MGQNRERDLLSGILEIMGKKMKNKKGILDNLDILNEKLEL